MSEKKPAPLKTKLLKQVRAEVYIRQERITNKDGYKVEAKGEPSIYCLEKELAIGIMREERLDAAYRIAKKERDPGKLKL